MTHPRQNANRRRNWVIEREREVSAYQRVTTLSDGVFAIALTLLALSLELPAGLSGNDLTSGLLDLSPMLLAFAISVGIIGLFWYSHHELFGELERVDTRLIFINFVYLALVTLIPFVQKVQGGFPLESVSYVMYAGVLALLNLTDTVLRVHAHRAKLLRLQWTGQRFRNEVLRGAVLTVGFLLSIPLSFVLVNWTVFIWILLLPLDQFLARRMQP